MNKVLFIGGATASGKTDISLDLARKYNGEIISADSRQIYIGMDIGTAKVATRQDFSDDKNDLVNSPILVEGIPHYLIDIVYPDQRYTLFDFKRDAYNLIQQIQQKGKTPIVVGGTGLYIDALINNYSLEDSVKEDSKVRQKLEKEAAKFGAGHMWDKLNKIDQYSAEKIHPNNSYAIVRALEFALINNGEAKTKKAKKNKPPFEYVLILTKMDRSELYKKIEQRIDLQIEQGLIEETKKLLELYDPNLPALSSIGYKEISDYLNSECSLEEAVKLFKQHTRNYAKRQLTWFRRYSKS
jgi:tRNA dimethylallyltransferase